MIVCDVNVLIALLNAHDAHHEDALSLFENLFLDGFCATVLTVAEALVHPTRDGMQDAALASLSTIGIQIVSLESSETANLARIRNQYRLRMPAAAVLQAAISTASEVATCDELLARAAGKAGLTVVARWHLTSEPAHQRSHSLARWNGRMTTFEPNNGVPWLTEFIGPTFFATALGPAIVVSFALLILAPISIYAHRWWMHDATLMFWVAVAIAGGPFGAIAWFAWGRPAVQRFRDGGDGAVSAER